MKNIAKFFALAVVIFGFSANSFGQISATASASATIVAAISINHTGTNMNFGYIIPGAGGTVQLPAAATPTRVSSLILPGGTVTAAEFTITGTDGSLYQVTLPADATITVAKTGETAMAVNSFSCDISGSSVVGVTATGTLSGTTKVFHVGATLSVGSGQTAGAYTTASEFPVTVAYN